MSKLTESAKGQECLIRVPGVCNYDPSTTVLAHLNGGGMGMKHNDLFGSFACSDCHNFVDSRDDGVNIVSQKERRLLHVDGVLRTQEIWLKAKMIKVVGQDSDDGYPDW